MKKYLVLTIDVEPDCTPSWQYSSPLTFLGVAEGIAKRLQPLFNQYGIVPTYLINNVVLEDQASINVFRNLEGKYELGTHLHPEFIEPEKSHNNYAGKKGIANSCFYDPKIEFEKIKTITQLFSDKFGYKPLSFRAGRFSAGLNTISSLSKLGYKVDTSVTPNIRWDDKTREKAVDFRSAPVQPYWIGDSSMTRENINGNILEVPVSIMRKKLSIPQYLKYLLKNKRIPYKGSRPMWLRPVFSGIGDFEMIIKKISLSYSTENIIVYNMMFHNVEVMPGLSPYSQTEQDCDQYLYSLEWLFQYCQENNIQSLALAGLHDVFKNKK